MIRSWKFYTQERETFLVKDKNTEVKEIDILYLQSDTTNFLGKFKF